jgi:phenylacetate-CoA ligase
MSAPRWFVRHLTYPLIFPMLRGTDGRVTLRLCEEYTRRERWPLERHREEQWRRIRALLAHAHAHCPFHRRRFEEIGAAPGDFRSLEDFARFPPLRRREIQEHLDDLIAGDFDPRRYELHSTSGSTGTPLRFAADKSRYAAARAMLHRNHRWCGVDLGERHAYLWASFNERMTAQSFRYRLGHWVLNQQFHSAWSLSDEDLAAINGKLLRGRPRLLTTFPSTLTTYAHLVQRRGLRPPPLTAIISSGETLFPNQRALAEEVFGCRVFNRYGDMELGDIAHECEAHDGMHVNEERVYVEIEPDPELPNGTGDIIVTDLDNWSMPFLRYQTEDLGRWHADPTGCVCGRPLRRLAEVQGRRYDIVVDREGVPINGLVLEDLGSGAAGVAQFQCVQRSPERLLYRVVPLSGFTAEQIRQNILERSRLSIGPERFEIEVELVEEIAHSKSGKLRQIVSEIAPGNSGD